MSTFDITDQIICKVDGPNEYTRHNYAREPFECYIEKYPEKIYYGELVYSDTFRSDDVDHTLTINSKNVCIKCTNLHITEDGMVKCNIKFLDTKMGKLAQSLYGENKMRFGVRAIVIPSEDDILNLRDIPAIDIITSK
jgi:hypothetical protein